MVSINMMDMKNQRLSIPTLYSTFFTLGFAGLDTKDVFLF